MTMMLLIHIAVPIVNIDRVKDVIMRCCAETGDEPIGYRAYEDIDEALFVIRLVGGNHYLSKHTQILNHALQQQVISSFQPETTNLIDIHCNPQCTISEHMHNFPLQPSESWFPSISDKHIAYLCTRRSLISSAQTAWIVEQGLDYHYVQPD